MPGETLIVAPNGADDYAGAQRVFLEFNLHYRPVLEAVEHSLHTSIEKMPAIYAEGYRPWLKALRDLMQGVYLIAKKIPLPNPESFQDALSIFRLESSARLLSDFCLISGIQIALDWAKKFRQHIELLLFSLNILQRGKEAGMSR